METEPAIAPIEEKKEEKQVKEGRIIVRNLPFDLKEAHLKIPFFERYGKLVSINVPVNNANNLNKGFAFLEYESKAEALKAIEGLNGQQFKGRMIALALSVPKGRYETRV
jgi:RNA recognition motif-containing protein